MLEFYTQKINTHVPISVIRIVGGIDSSNFNLFQEYVDGHLKEGATYILLDFEGVSHISSAGLRVVHNLFNKLRALHKDVNDDELRKKMSMGEYKSPFLKITSLAPNISEIFNIGGFDIYIEIFSDKTAAINSF